MALIGVVLGLGLLSSRAQVTSGSNRIYTLIQGSELTDDCPICDRVPIVVPMTGTFRLRYLEQSPVFTRYELQEIHGLAGGNGSPEYQVNGVGTYQIGGEVAVTQDVFLNVNINNGFAITSALCVNSSRSVTQPWPTLEILVQQTNGTAAKVYSLKLVAVPALQFLAITPDPRTGNVRLEWDSGGSLTQVERSVVVEGPYAPASSITTNQVFTDVGALTNRSLFYRLHRF